MKILFLFLAFGLVAPTEVWACKVGVVTTSDGAFDIRVRVASPNCASEAGTQPVSFLTSDSVALKIQVSPHGTRQTTRLVEVKHVGLRRDDGLLASSEPSVRKLSDGMFFADNLEFAAAGTWYISLTLLRQQREEVVKVSVPVKLDPEQAAQIAANALRVPDFALQDPRGRTITGADLHGKVWVASFFFASCPEICPLMSQKLAALQRQFKDASDFRIVSVTTDPKNDTPAVLESLAKRHNADMSRWFFLRGQKRAVIALSSNGLKLDVTAESPMHSTRFAVVDRDGVVKGRYDSEKTEELEQLTVAVKELLEKRPIGKLSKATP